MKNTLRINGSVVASASPVANNAGEPLIHYKDAMRAILAYEEATPLPDIVREELPAIVSHWLQSPEDAPILLDESYSERWMNPDKLGQQPPSHTDRGLFEGHAPRFR